MLKEYETPYICIEEVYVDICYQEQIEWTPLFKGCYDRPDEIVQFNYITMYVTGFVYAISMHSVSWSVAVNSYYI